jgi:hypothetical protein
MNLFENNGAAFSPCKKYRYALWRIWDDSKPKVMFIGLNPSTADANNDDPTIKRVRAITTNLGYGGFYMMNLFAIISPYPEVLKTCADPIGQNDYWLTEIAAYIQTVVFAWGNFKEAEKRTKEVITKFPNAKALHINKNGSPKHPLYCRADSQLVSFTQQ